MKLEPTNDHWCWKKPGLFVYYPRPWNWNNLMAWLEKYYRGETLPQQQIDPDFHDLDDPVVPVMNAFRLVNILSNDPWKKVKRALEAYLEGVQASADFERKFG